MSMNKVVHAAQRAAFSAAIDSAIKGRAAKALKIWPSRPSSSSTWPSLCWPTVTPDADWDKVRAFVSDPGSKWMEYAYKAINEIDPTSSR